MKKALLVVLFAIFSLTLIACDGSKTNGKVQGITDEYILVGNTAATSGAFAGVGVPFNLAMQVVFDEYNAAHDGRDIKFVHYDDGFDVVPGTALSLTKKLVEEDKVFALVGHFGTNTVNATMDYLLESGVPMVYGVTGVNSLYFGNDKGNNILSIQPIYRSEGQMMVARALHESLFGANKDQKLGADAKILVLYSTDDAGTSIKAGIEDGIKAQNVAASRVTYLPFSATDASAQVTTGLAGNPDVILLSANQAPATAAATALREQNSTVPVLSSYVNGATVFTPAQAKDEAGVALPLPYEVYANAWVDIVEAGAAAPTAEQVGGDGTLVGWSFGLELLAGYTSEYWDFVKLMNDSTRADGATTAKALWANAYAMAGYVAAKAFVELLEKVEDFDKLTWESFIALAEKESFKLPLAGTIDWTDGKRRGLTDLSLNRLVYSPTVSFVKVREVESIDTVNKK